MQKVKTVEYEVLARLRSTEPLYEFYWQGYFVITSRRPGIQVEKYWRDCYPNTSIKEFKNKFGFDFVYARTVRGAWKKVCKQLNK
jgi:hypothetical protein